MNAVTAPVQTGLTPPGEAVVDAWWADGARRAIEQLAALGEPFDATDVRVLVGCEPAVANQWGTLFRNAAQDGLIQQAGTALSRVVSRKSGLVRQWIGCQR